MMVCLCESVSERKVRRAIEHGARTLDEVAAACRAGTGCGGCHPTICEMLVEVAQPVRLVVA
jgi:bacterioferritin-associated ferredoxin